MFFGDVCDLPTHGGLVHEQLFASMWMIDQSYFALYIRL